MRRALVQVPSKRRFKRMSSFYLHYEIWYEKSPKPLKFRGFSVWHLFWSYNLVAGVGFEPHDLRVMSPTSYQAALPRDILWCRKPGSNRYGTFVPLDFKSKASANSAIPARWHTLVSLHPCLQGLYSISPLGLFVNTYRQSFLHQAENKHCRNA